MPRKKLLACKLTSAHVYNVPDVVPAIKLSLNFFGRIASFTDFVKISRRAVGSEGKDFLSGKKVLVENGRMTLCLSRGYVDGLKGDYQQFLDSLFLPLVEGGRCSVDDWGSAAVSVVPESWSILNMVIQDAGGTCSQQPYCMMKVGFKAWVQIDEPLVSKPLRFFFDGFCVNGMLECSPLNRERYEILLGVLENQEQLYINRDTSFYMVAPRNKKELKKVFAREIEKSGFSIFDFAKLAAFVASECDLRKGLLISRNREAFTPDPPAVGPISAGMFGGQMRVRYPYAPRVAADLPANCEGWSLLTDALPELCAQLKLAPCKCRDAFRNRAQGSLGESPWRFSCGVQGARVFLEMYPDVMDEGACENAFEMYDRVTKNVACFGEALMKFRQKYLGGASFVLKEILELVWNKVEMDPLTCFEDENPFVARIAATVLEDKF